MAKKLTFYKINEQEIIYSSSFSRRLGARLLDFLIAGIVGKLLLTIYSSCTVPYLTQPPTQEFSYYLIDQYNAVMMVGWSLLLSGYITSLYIFPLLNRKHPGQTIGKMILHIAPMYLHSSKPYKSIMIREGFVSGLQIVSLIFIMCNGTNPSYIFAKYQTYNYGLYPDGLPASVWTNYWDFIMYGWTDPNIMGDQAATSLNVGFAYVSTIAMIFWMIMLIAITLSIAFVPSKRGFHDMFTSVAVVNLRSVKDKDSVVDLYTPQKGEESNVLDLPVKLKK